jgi:hypothetical protein
MHRPSGQVRHTLRLRSRPHAKGAVQRLPGRGSRSLWFSAICVPATLALTWIAWTPAAGAEPIDQGQELVQQAAAMFFPEARETSERAAGSATATLNHIKYLESRGDNLTEAQLGSVAGFLQRPDWLPLTRATKHFRIHFSAEPTHAPLGWPQSDAYLTAAQQACEQAWTLYHETQNWPVPPNIDRELTEPIVHVYVMDLGSGVLGYALHEDLEDATGHAGYIVVDNDFVGFDVSRPLQALALTLAHEYHHVVQFGFGYDPEANWFMEQTATMEEACFSWDPAEMSTYLDAFGSHANRRLDSTNGYFEYGAWLWPRFIVERWGWDALFEIWSTWSGGAVPMLASISVVLEEAELLQEERLTVSRPDAGTLDAAFLEWATRNALLGEARPVPGHQHAQGAELPAVVSAEFIIDHYPVTGLSPEPTRQPEPLGANYVFLKPRAGSADNTLSIDLSASPGLAGVQLVVLDAAGGPGRVMPGALRGGKCSFEIEGWHQAARAVLVLTTGLDSPNACAYRVDASTRLVPKNGSAGVDPIAEGQDRLWLRAAPNPFEPYTILQYELPASDQVRIRIVDAQGRLVTLLFDGTASAGRHGVYWDGRAVGGARASAGVYYGLLESSSGTREIRVVRVR